MESPFYRVNLESILEYTQGRHLLSVTDVMRYTGLGDTRTVRRRFPFVNGGISAETLAKCLSAVPEKGLKRGLV